MVNDEGPVPTLVLMGTPALVAGAAYLLEDSRYKVVSPLHFSDDEHCLVIVDGATVGVARQRFPLSKMVIFLDRPTADDVRYAVAKEIRGIIRSDSHPRAIPLMLDLVMAGEVMYPANLVLELVGAHAKADDLIRAPSKGEKKELSSRETEVLRCLMVGDSNKIIAQKFSLSEATVKVHLKSILRKLGANNRTQAAMMAQKMAGELRPRFKIVQRENI